MSKIYEKDHTGQIRSRKSGDYGNEKIEHSKHYYNTDRNKGNDVEDIKQPTQEEIIAFNQMEAEMDKVIHPVRKQIRAEVLDELWAADKLNKDGYWYVKLSDVIKIIGEE